MKTQYFQEDGAGNRTSVPEHVWLIDKAKHNYRQLHAFGVMIVYRLI